MSPFLPNSNQATAPPVVRELRPLPDAVDVFQRLKHLPYALFLDSALRNSVLGRYSFVAADPFDFVQVCLQDGDALKHLQERMLPFASQHVPDLPPFQGGAAGLWSYDLGRQWERLPVPKFDPYPLPAMAVGLYDVVVAFDHQTRRAWIISHGWPATGPTERQRRASARADEFATLLQQTPDTVPAHPSINMAAQLPPLHPVVKAGLPKGLMSNFTEAEYLKAAPQAIDYIHAGDVFQVNLSQRLFFPAQDDPCSLYLRLRQRNPAPFAGYFDWGGGQILSASPERFLRVENREVETRPIKGTRHRAGLPEADLFTGDQLQASAKDRAENIMIVDLMRNDLSKVCEADSVQVTQLCRVENFQFVQHLVSEIRGRLRPECGPLDLLRGAFPGGSITGAPKPRAMEIITELEQTARGAYCGSLGYLGFDGGLDTSILIRTLTAGGPWWQISVGGGIVAQSEPREEYEETWHKAQGMLRALSLTG